MLGELHYCTSQLAVQVWGPTSVGLQFVDTLGKGRWPGWGVPLHSCAALASALGRYSVKGHTPSSRAAAA